MLCTTNAMILVKLLAIYFFTKQIEQSNADVHMGCFSKSPSGPFSVLTLTDNMHMSHGLCRDLCYSNGYMYMGIFNGTQCFCGTYAELQKATPVPNSDCSTQCNVSVQNCDNCRLGNLQQDQCGGPQAVSVHKIGFLPYRHEGCYQDNDIRVFPMIALSGWDHYTGAVSPALCYEYCSTHKYEYFGVEDGNQCFCGQQANFQVLSPLPSNEVCNVTCQYVNRLTCGGVWKITIYKTLLFN